MLLLSLVLLLSAVARLPNTTAWAPAPSPLMTRWAKDVHPDQVPAYPRPMMVRPPESWQHLDGLWEIDITKANTRGFGTY